MGAFVLRRAAQAVGVIWAAYTITFVILYLIPGDPVEMMLNGGGGGNGAVADLGQIDQLRAQYGFDRPVIVQYLVLLGKALTGDFGVSMQTGKTVADTIAFAFPQTAALTALATGFAIVSGTVVAVAAARSDGWLRSLLATLPSVGVSVPVFWVGFLLIQKFSLDLGYFPAVGNKGAISLVLPALTLAVPASATIAQVLFGNLVWAQTQPFIGAVRAKGASEWRLVLAHGLRNACLPVITMIGMIVGSMLAGSVVVETVFSRSGIGQVLAMAVRTKDIPVVQGLVVLAAVVFVVINVIVDLVYPLLDPRVRTEVTAS